MALAHLRFDELLHRFPHFVDFEGEKSLRQVFSSIFPRTSWAVAEILPLE
jgi:hypothetical protein